MAASLAIKLVAEFLASFLLMISILASGGNFLIIGATLGVIVFLTGGISGAAVNPAVAAGLYYSGTLDLQTFLFYSFIEIVGMLAATYSYKVIA